MVPPTNRELLEAFHQHHQLNQQAMHKQGYHLQERTELFAHPRFTVYEEIHQIADKGNHAFTTVHTFDWVMIVPRRKSSTGDWEYLLIEQYRAAWRVNSVEFPAGKMDDPQEDPQEAAQRELIEETGFRADKLQLLGITKPVTWTNQTAYIYVAEDLIRDDSLTQDPSEDISTMWVTEQELKHLMISGGILENPTLAAMTLVLLQDDAHGS